MSIKINDVVCVSTDLYGGLIDKIGLIIEIITPKKVFLVRVEQEYGLADLIFISRYDDITVIGEL